MFMYIYLSMIHSYYGKCTIYNNNITFVFSALALLCFFVANRMLLANMSHLTLKTNPVF
jgi:hypothetical protein